MDTSSSSDDDDDDLLLVSSKHYQPAPQPMTKRPNSINHDEDDDDDDDDDDLEVLPPSSFAAAAARKKPKVEVQAKQKKTSSDDDDGQQQPNSSLNSNGKPRLSFTGNNPHDPLDIDNDDDAASAANGDTAAAAATDAVTSKTNSNFSNLVKRRGDDINNQQKPPAAAAAAATASNARRVGATQKLLKLSSSLSFSSNDDDDDEAWNQPRQAAAKRLKAAAATDDSSSKSSNSSSSDSVLDVAHDWKNKKPVAAAKATAVVMGRKKMAPAAAAGIKNKTTASAAASAEIKAANAARKKQEQALERERKAVEKERLKQQAQQEKLTARQEKARQKEAQLASRKRLREQRKQQRGGYCTLEMCILLDPPLYHDEPDNKGDKSSCFNIPLACRNLDYEHVYPYASGFCGGVSASHKSAGHAVQWIRRDYLHGGATQAFTCLSQRGGGDQKNKYNSATNNSHGKEDEKQQHDFEHLPMLAIVVEGQDFIEMIQHAEGEHDVNSSSSMQLMDEDDGDDYPRLEQWLFGIVAGWRAAWKKTTADRPRIILLLHQAEKKLDELWQEYTRSNKNKKGGRGGRTLATGASSSVTTRCPPNSEQLKDAILWMLIQFQIECIRCKTTEDVALEIAKMTRLQAENRHKSQVTTELECIKGLKARVSDQAPMLDRAQDAWMRQVQQVPRVSAEMARHFVQYYPTMRSLWLAFQQADADDSMTDEQRDVLCATCFGQRNPNYKISRWLHRILTSKDPNELIT